MKKIFYYYLLVLVFFSQALSADTFYKGTDAAGNTIYSDQPIDNGKKIEVEIPQSYSTPPLKEQAVVSAKEAEPIKYVIQIIAPKKDETFTTDINSVQVMLSIKPELQPEHKIKLMVNGQMFKGLFSGTVVTLEDLARGAYAVQAQVVSEKDPTKVLAKSDTVTFYQKRAIANHVITGP